MPEIFLLGANDPEMHAIQTLLEGHKMPFVYATVDGRRVSPGNSYRADPVTVSGTQQLVVIECAYDQMPEETCSIDHHRPSDPGFYLGPDRFWEASSIGQLHQLLCLEPTHEALVMAAFDHCFAAGVRGECEGVTPGELIDLRFVEIHHETGSDYIAVVEMVALFRKKIGLAPEFQIGEQRVKDFQSEDLGTGYSLEYLCAQLAAYMEGCAVLFAHHDPVRKAPKVTLTGHVSPDTVHSFMGSWGPAHHLSRFFGVEVRGYAGGFLEDSSSTA